jgi:hypothetical protein
MGKVIIELWIVFSTGCASLQYLKGDKMALSMKVGDVTLRNITISGE